MAAVSVDAISAQKANNEDAQSTSRTSDPTRWKIDHYNIFHKPVKFIIFDHYEFDEMAISKAEGDNKGTMKSLTRTGTEKDSERLEIIFKNLGFEEAAPCQKDKCHNEIIKKLNEVLEQSDAWSAIIFVILTHGEDRSLYASDKKYAIEELKKLFTENGVAEKLAGKPKIFIIQACQGEEVDDGVAVGEGGGDVEEEEEDEETIIPIMADFLFAFSSASGYVAYRGKKTGSWFIQTLCDAIYDLKDKEDFESILTLVKHDIAYTKITYNPDKTYNAKKQIPEVTSTLTKKLYLTRKAVNKIKIATSSDQENEPSDVVKPKAIENVETKQTVQDSATSGRSSQEMLSNDNAKNLMQWIWILLVIITTLVGTWLLFLKSQPEYHFHCYSTVQNSTEGNVHFHQEL